jgi:hypothetical protein
MNRRRALLEFLASKPVACWVLLWLGVIVVADCAHNPKPPAKECAK